LIGFDLEQQQQQQQQERQQEQKGAGVFNRSWLLLPLVSEEKKIKFAEPSLHDDNKFRRGRGGETTSQALMQHHSSSSFIFPNPQTQMY
jgi:hypothetical protein